MAYNLPPPPNPDADINDYSWRDWFRQLRDFIGNVVQDHQKLNNLQGGNVSERYHLSREQYVNLNKKQIEIQVAGVNQTVFTLTSISYSPGTNSLSVFVDGLNQIMGPGYAYLETSPTVVTFTESVPENSIVKFVVG